LYGCIKIVFLICLKGSIMVEPLISHHTELPDSILINRVVQRDSQALARLYNKYQRKVYSVVLRIVKNEEDTCEVLQDVFLQVWEKANLFDSTRGTFSGWLIAVAHNKAINLLRSRRWKKKRFEITQDLEQLSQLNTNRTVEPRTALDDQLETDEREQILSLLEQIPSEQQMALLLAYYKGYSQSEIAMILALPLGTIKTRMRQGIIRLRNLIGENIDGFEYY
jgi:RNA polymerase sigma-70 factor (ECF subfamily)